jgi:predicted ATPase
VSQFVGRNDALAALTAAYVAVTDGPAGGRRRAGLVLVSGEAGMGKTALLGRFEAEVVRHGGTVVWGTCWDGGQAPALWPWTQALCSLLDDRAELRATVASDLAAIVPGLATISGPDGDGTATDQLPVTDDSVGRLRVFDATSRLLGRTSGGAPLVVMLDDLQWADRSTVDLLRFVIGQSHPGPLLLIGAFRPEELNADIAPALAVLGAAADVVELRGLAADEVAALVEAIAGPLAVSRWARAVQERSGGHPFFARELCRLLAAGGESTAVPAAVQEVIARRLGRLSDRASICWRWRPSLARKCCRTCSPTRPATITVGWPGWSPRPPRPGPLASATAATRQPASRTTCTGSRSTLDCRSPAG